MLHLYSLVFISTWLLAPVRYFYLILFYTYSSVKFFLSLYLILQILSNLAEIYHLSHMIFYIYFNFFIYFFQLAQKLSFTGLMERFTNKLASSSTSSPSTLRFKWGLKQQVFLSGAIKIKFQKLIRFSMTAWWQFKYTYNAPMTKYVGICAWVHVWL